MSNVRIRVSIFATIATALDCACFALPVMQFVAREARVASRASTKGDNVSLSDGALWWRLLKKSKNSHCLCAIAVLRNGVKIVALRASRVTHALARTSACFERTLFVFVCDVKRVARARKGSHSVASGTSIWDQIIVFAHTIFDVFGLGSSPFLSGFKYVYYT